MKHSSPSTFLLALFLLPALRAHAVIEAKNPLSQIYTTTAQTIVSGKVAKIDADAKTLTITVTDTLKGAKPGDSLTVTVSNPADLLKSLTPDAPFLAFFAKGIALVHADDRWFLARPAPGNAGLTITGPHATGSKDTFPGTTTALIAATKELSATGKSTLLNALGDRTLNGTEREVAKLPGIRNPTSFVTLDANKDGKADLLICSDGRPHLFTNSDKGYIDETEKRGLSTFTGDIAAVFARPETAIQPAEHSFDLLLRSQVLAIDKDGVFRRVGLIHDAPPFSTSLAVGLDAFELADTGSLQSVKGLSPFVIRVTTDSSQVIKLWIVKRDNVPSIGAGSIRFGGLKPAINAAIIGRFGESEEPFVIGTTEKSVLRFPVTVPGPPSTQPDGSATPSAAVPADDLRLTGSKLTDYHEAHKKDGFKNPQLVGLDANGDGRQDLFLRADGGNLLLVNRGFGAFLVDPDAGKALTRKGLLAAAALKPNDKKQSLLILTPEGTLYAIDTVAAPH